MNEITITWPVAFMTVGIAWAIAAVLIGPEIVRAWRKRN